MYKVNQVLSDIASSVTLTSSLPFHGGQKRLDDFAIPLGLMHRPRTNGSYTPHSNVGILPDSKFDELFDKISSESTSKSHNKTKSKKPGKNGKQTKRK